MGWAVRELAEPFAGTVMQKRYVDQGSMLDAGQPPRARGSDRTAGSWSPDSPLGERHRARARLEQLASIKAAYDPDNLIRLNRNIWPLS